MSNNLCLPTFAVHMLTQRPRFFRKNHTTVSVVMETLSLLQQAPANPQEAQKLILAFPRAPGPHARPRGPGGPRSPAPPPRRQPPTPTPACDLPTVSSSVEPSPRAPFPAPTASEAATASLGGLLQPSRQ